METRCINCFPACLRYTIQKLKNVKKLRKVHEMKKTQEIEDNNNYKVTKYVKSK